MSKSVIERMARRSRPFVPPTMGETKIFIPDIEECYAKNIGKLSHHNKVTSGQWVYGDKGIACVFALKPKQKVFFDLGYKSEPDSVRLFTLFIKTGAYFHDDSILLSMEAFYNHPDTSKEIKSGINEFFAYDSLSRKRYAWEIKIGKDDPSYKVKRRYTALFNWMVKDFGL